MDVLQANLSLCGHPHVRDHGASLDRVCADQVRHRAQRAGQRVTEIPEPSSFEKGHAPTIYVAAGSASAFAETPERKTKIRGSVCLPVTGDKGAEGEDGGTVNCVSAGGTQVDVLAFNVFDHLY